MKWSLSIALNVLFLSLNLFAQSNPLYQVDSNIPSYMLIENKEIFLENSSDDVIETLLGLNDQTHAILKDSYTDVKGNQHFFYEEYYDGYKVYGSRCALHYRNNIAHSITNNFITIEDLDTNIGISVEAAVASVQQAIAEIGYSETICTSEPELMIFSDKGTSSLAYHFYVASQKDGISYHAFVSAVTGKILFLKNSIVYGRAATLHYGIQDITTSYEASGYYTLHDNDRNLTTYFNGIIPTDADDDWTETGYQTSGVAACCEVHYAMECAYDYFYNTFGRDSYDDNHGSINCTILESFDNNAAFNYNESLFKFGETINQYFEALDIVSHEYGHAVFYYCIGQCGTLNPEANAINEGMSDIWGACVENEYFPNTSNVWKSGDVLNNPIFWRSLNNPKTYSYPDTYLGTYWDANGEEHKNSTVFSHWFYLLSQGGSGRNDIGNNYNVRGIGISAAAQICYQALRAYFLSNINFSLARDYTLYAAADLYGEYSEEYLQTLNAWYAVGVGETIKITSRSILVCPTDTFEINVLADYLSWDVYPSTLTYSTSSNSCIVTSPSCSNQYTGYVVATVNGIQSYTKFFEVGDFVPDMANAYHGTNGTSENISLSSSTNYLQFEFDSGYYSESELSTLMYNTRLVNIDTGGITYVGTICGSGLVQLSTIPGQIGTYDIEVQGPCSGDWIYVWSIEVTH